MGRSQASGKAASRSQKKDASAGGEPPPPFKPASPSLEPLYSVLNPSHVYITHIDSHPTSFKRKMFTVPVLMNVAVVLLLFWRAWYIFPHYAQLLFSVLGHTNETTVKAAELTWGQLITIVLRRAFTFFLDFLLAVFVWPWPIEFVIGDNHGSPAWWRWRVGFRDKEVYVRRSRAWDQELKGDVITGPGSEARRKLLLGNVRAATSRVFLQEKTGYVTMNGQWDLDWAVMVHVTKLVDAKETTFETLRTIVFVHDKAYGWMTVDAEAEEHAADQQRQKEVLAFRKALAAVDKEDLFYRWIEMVQFESTKPGGFGPERQAEAAKKIRDLFDSNGINFDTLWNEAQNCVSESSSNEQ